MLFQTIVLHTSYPYVCYYLTQMRSHNTLCFKTCSFTSSEIVMHIWIVKKIIQKNSQRHCSFIKPDYSIFWLFTTDHPEAWLSGLLFWHNRVKEMPWHLEKAEEKILHHQIAGLKRKGLCVAAILNSVFWGVHYELASTWGHFLTDFRICMRCDMKTEPDSVSSHQDLHSHFPYFKYLDAHTCARAHTHTHTKQQNNRNNLQGKQQSKEKTST